MLLLLLMGTSSQPATVAPKVKGHHARPHHVTVEPGSSPPPYDVLVYGSTPAGIIAAVSAARHGGKTAVLSQRAHIGGMCTGGLGQTDIGSCADEVIGGLAREFFNRSAASYTIPQPRSPWNLEPHVARQVFVEMLRESGATILPPAEVEL